MKKNCYALRVPISKIIINLPKHAMYVETQMVTRVLILMK